MAFVVEDGSGLATATSFAAVAAFRTWAADRGLTVPTPDAECQAALVRASDYVSDATLFRYIGTKANYAQGLAWPRAQASERDGVEIPATVVPPLVLRATFAAAYAATSGAALFPTLDNGGAMVTNKRIDVLSTSWAAAGGGMPASARALITEVRAMLGTLLREGGLQDDLIAPTLTLGAVSDPFAEPA
jgi:hypothetical protein